MNPAGTRTVQNILETPGGTPLPGQNITVRLNVFGFIDGGTKEKLRQLYTQTDSTGRWSMVLEVNSDIDPAGTFYTVREGSGGLWTFVVPAGDVNTPVNLRDVLQANPSNPDPVSIGAGVSAIDGGSA